MKTYGPVGPRRYRTYEMGRKRIAPADHSGAAFVAVVAFIVLFGLSMLFRYINPDPTIHWPVDPEAPVVERPTFHEVR